MKRLPALRNNLYVYGLLPSERYSTTASGWAAKGIAPAFAVLGRNGKTTRNHIYFLDPAMIDSLVYFLHYDTNARASILI